MLALAAVACSGSSDGSSKVVGPPSTPSLTIGANSSSIALTAYTLNKPSFVPGAITQTFSPKVIVFRNADFSYNFSGTWGGKTTIKYPSPKPDTGNGGMVQVFVLTPGGFEVIGSVDADNSALEAFEFPTGGIVELRAFAMPGYKFRRYEGVPGTLEERSNSHYRLAAGASTADIRAWFQEVSPGSGGGGGGEPCPDGAIICDD
jgi:hypothetical protein